MLRKRIQIGKRQLVNTTGDSCFWVNNGAVLGNIVDLKNALSSMSDETFAYHANGKKNDFAKWVEDVLMDSELAKKLSASRGRKAALKEVEARLKSVY